MLSLAGCGYPRKALGIAEEDPITQMWLDLAEVRKDESHIKQQTLF